MKTKISFLLTLFLLIISSSLFSQENKLTLKLSIEKTVYNYSELIVARVKYINNDTIPHTLIYNCSLEDDISNRLIFKDDYGVPNRVQGLIIDCIGNPIPIKPGDSYTSYGVPIFTDKHIGYSTYFEPGSYSVYMKGSDTVKLTIGYDENDDSYNRFKEYSAIKNKYERFLKWREFLYDSRNKSYLNLAYYELTSLNKYYEGDYKLMNKDMSYLFGVNPNAWYTDVHLFHYSFFLRDYLKEENLMIQFLEKLAKKNPDSRVSYIANKILKDKKIPDFSY